MIGQMIVDYGKERAGLRACHAAGKLGSRRHRRLVKRINTDPLTGGDILHLKYHLLI